MRSYIKISINGTVHSLSGAWLWQPLAATLRQKFNLWGTKIVCNEGDCGACSVLAFRPHPRDGQWQQLVVNACISMTALWDGCSIVTVEGLGQESGELDSIQEQLVAHQGSQCGFCTPGFAVALADLYSHTPKPSCKRLKNQLTGNLCRCTGYQPILEACEHIDESKLTPLKKLYLNQGIKDQLALDHHTDICAEWQDKTLFSSTSLQRSLEFMATEETTCLASGTDLGVAYNKRGGLPRRLMILGRIPELLRLEIGREDQTSILGAGLSWEELRRELTEKHTAFSDFLNIFAAPPIKNVATIGGNIANGSPVGDSLVYLLAAGAQVELTSSNGQRLVDFSKLYTGYKKMARSSDELLTAIHLPPLAKQHRSALYKISQRRDLDISAVAVAVVATYEGQKITGFRAAFGGVAATVMEIPALNQLLINHDYHKPPWSEIRQLVEQEVKPLSDVRGTSSYRMRSVMGSLERFFWEWQQEGEPCIS